MPGHKKAGSIRGNDLFWILDRFQKGSFSEAQLQSLFTDAGFGSWDAERSIRRVELAVVLDRLVDPFRSRAVDHQGNFKSP
jgi:hypothetical protein